MAYNKHKKDGNKPAAYVHQAWPAWFYGPDGQSAIFNGPLEVPEGWHDNPDKVGDSKAVTEIPGLDEAEAALQNQPSETDEEELKKGDEELGLPPYDTVTAKQIQAALDKEGVPYSREDDKLALYKLFRDTLLATE